MHGVAICVLLAGCGRIGFENIDESSGGVSVGFANEMSLEDEDSGTVAISVILSEPAEVPISVRYGITGGTAERDVDYTATEGMLAFSVGETEQAIEIDIVSDGIVESDETIELTLTSSSGAVLGAREHTLTIRAVPCLGEAAYTVCPPDSPASPLMLSGTLDTTTSPLCAAAQPPGWVGAGQPPSCFVFAPQITINTTLDVTGARPLVLAATDSIDVRAVLDVASHPLKVGPGALSATCAAFPGVPDAGPNGGGGGVGGPFMTGGGGGGGHGTTGGLGGVGGSGQSLTLRAGCDGQRGGTGDVAAGPAGRGGGAVYLVAKNTITITGGINASGGGATGGGNSSGGSGGGSGGMIKLFASTIASSGALIANGGGGASGANDGVSTGAAGADPSIATPLVPAAGGTDVNGGDGGRGMASSMNQTGGSNGANNAGGGGGGGGGGLIESNQPLDGITSAGRVLVN